MKYLSWNTIVEKRNTKNKLFKGLNKTFDYALPQEWLNEMANKGLKYGITYDMIMFTTVWVYPESMPFTCCHEVQQLFNDTIFKDYVSKYL